jgi:hypothetical protein
MLSRRVPKEMEDGTVYTNERLYEMHLKELRQEIAYNYLVREAEATRKQKPLALSSVLGKVVKHLLGYGAKTKAALLGKNEVSPVQIIRLEKTVRAG